jgi:hypothetical protein
VAAAFNEVGSRVCPSIREVSAPHARRGDHEAVLVFVAVEIGAKNGAVCKRLEGGAAVWASGVVGSRANDLGEAVGVEGVSAAEAFYRQPGLGWVGGAAFAAEAQGGEGRREGVSFVSAGLVDLVVPACVFVADCGRVGSLPAPMTLARVGSTKWFQADGAHVILPGLWSWGLG